MTELEATAARLEFEKRKLDLEERKAALEEQSQSVWVRFATQLSVVVPIVTLMIGALLSRHEAIAKSRRDFIHRQLTEFYYPLKFRLQRDTATWPLAFLNCDPSNKAQDPTPKALCDVEKKNPEFSHQIQVEVLIPNQAEAIGIINKHLDLVRNSEEDPAVASDVLQAISQYHTHTVCTKL
jgi:hypothetical protein